MKIFVLILIDSKIKCYTSHMPAQSLTNYCENTHTGQYAHHGSLTLWNHKVSWIRSLATRTNCICGVSL